MPGSNPPHELTLQDLVDGLRHLGLKAGDRIMVHSSLKSFGRVQGGPTTVILALQQVLTPQGTLMMPSFNHGHPFLPGGSGFYDPAHTPQRSGLIPETFWHLPGVFRSLDPMHPFACWGDRAQQYTQYHHRTLTMGPESPLGLLARDSGLALFLGAGYNANTFHHVVEMSMNVPCLGQRTQAHPVRLPDGRLVTGRTWGWREKRCPITDELRYTRLMAPYEKRSHIGPCQTILFKLADCYQVVAQALSHGLDGFPPCSSCPIRPRLTPFTVESDWDPAHNRPKPDSTAWTY